MKDVRDVMDSGGFLGRKDLNWHPNTSMFYWTTPIQLFQKSQELPPELMIVWIGLSLVQDDNFINSQKRARVEKVEILRWYLSK